MKKISPFILGLSTKTHPFIRYLELTISQQSLSTNSSQGGVPIVISSLVPNWNIGWLDNVQVLTKQSLLCEFIYNDHVMSRRHFCRTPFQPLAFSLSTLFFARFTKPWMEMVSYRCHIAVRLSSQPSFTLYTMTSSEVLCCILSIGKVDQLS